MTILAVTNFWLATPSVAPTVSNSTAGSIQIAHRRVNPDGTYTAPSPIRTNTVLPNTVTPQTYANPGDVARDEFLVSNDGGNTWRIVPRSVTLTGAQSIGAFDSTWAVASLPDTQESAATAVDFGTFLASNSATKTIWIINRTQDINSLSFSVLDQLNRLTDALNGILQISIVGVSPDSGNGTLNTSFNATKIYSRVLMGSGFFTLTANNPTAIKLELQLVNYPLTGLSENIDYQLSIVPNPVSAPSTTINPVRVGRIIDSISDEGLASGFIQDSDGLYVYLTTDTPNTIGSPASGANIAQPWTDKLYELIWTKYNTGIFTSTGGSSTKGASAAADYADNKRLTLPDLRDKTLAGRSSSNPLGSSAGANTITLTVNQLPSHTHTAQSAGAHTHTTDSQGNHSHTTDSQGNHSHTTDWQGNHTHTVSLGESSNTATGGTATRYRSGGNAPVVTDAAGAHTHTTTTAGAHGHTISSAGAHTHTTDSQGSHTHTISSTGSGEPIGVRQPTSYVHKLISTGY